jgi:hypothetical protein
MGNAEQSPFTRKLRLRRETLLELPAKDLANVGGGKCTCTTDFSNNCCGPNGSCKPVG